MSNFKKQKYKIVKNALDKKIADLIYKYFVKKRFVAKAIMDKKLISPFIDYFGIYGDTQTPETYSHYSDIMMETLLEDLLPLMKKETELDLYPTYSYARIYKKGDILHRHKDRVSCEISTTLNLGGDLWDIYLDPTGDSSVVSGYETTTKLKKNPNKGVKVRLYPGDMLIYLGCELEHWREEFKGENCGQVFLHYNEIKKENNNLYDGRPFLGLPGSFKKYFQ
jgi:hypothetical protein